MHIERCIEAREEVDMADLRLIYLWLIYGITDLWLPIFLTSVLYACVCRNERLYMGRMCTESEVLLQPGHKWNNIVFYNHTGLKTYPNYMMGGGYILSGDVSKMLLEMNAKLRLKFTPIEDATLGFWLMSMDLRHIDHPK